MKACVQFQSRQCSSTMNREGSGCLDHPFQFSHPLSQRGTQTATAMREEILGELKSRNLWGQCVQGKDREGLLHDMQQGISLSQPGPWSLAGFLRTL